MPQILVDKIDEKNNTVTLPLKKEKSTPVQKLSQPPENPVQSVPKEVSKQAQSDKLGPVEIVPKLNLFKVNSMKKIEEP